MKKFLLFAIISIGILSIIGCKEQPTITSPPSEDMTVIDLRPQINVYDAAGTTVQIRYWDTRTPNVKRTTNPFSPDGDPSYIYRLTHDWLRGDSLYAWLVSQGVLTLIPVYDPPQKYITVQDTVTDQNGNLIIGDIQVLNPNWDPNYNANYQQKKAELQVWLEANLELQTFFDYPYIPDGPTIKWEFVDMTKPYKDRYTATEVIPGKYADKWKRSWEMNAMERFAYWASKRSSPELEAKWLANGKLVY